MEEQRAGDAIASLAEAIAVQDELVNHRLALEWAQMLLTRLQKTWMQLETHETLAYEDKVTSQVRVIDEATTSLRNLHKTLAHLSHLLRAHRQHISKMKDPLCLS